MKKLVFSSVMAACFSVSGGAATCAWLGTNCGEDPEHVGEPAPNVWRYPDCTAGNAQVHCLPGLRGYFYRLGGTDSWEYACCPSNQVGEVDFQYDEHGVLEGFLVFCTDICS